MTRDPDCGVVLDEKTSKFKVRHRDETYYFCSVKCKKKLTESSIKEEQNTGKLAFLCPFNIA